MSGKETTELTPPTHALEVRARLVEALRLDLVGPWTGHALAEERLQGWVRPSNWYLTGPCGLRDGATTAAPPK